MKKYSKDVWMMARDVLIELGGDNNWIPLNNIVEGVRKKWFEDDVNENTIRCQVRIRCVNGHPGHDEYPDRGKMWREQPTFICSRPGRYRIYKKERDYDVYLAALREDGISLNGVVKNGLYKPSHIQPLVQPDTDVTVMEKVDNPLELLEEYGHRLGFQTQREWAIPLGRIDLVWYIELPVTLPQTVTNRIPVIGFEIETSWRTRKHIKGDIVNFQALKAPIGIIVQLTSAEDNPKDVADLIRNVNNFLKETGCSNILIWTDDDLVKIREELV